MDWFQDLWVQVVAAVVAGLVVPFIITSIPRDYHFKVEWFKDGAVDWEYIGWKGIQPFLNNTSENWIQKSVIVIAPLDAKYASVSVLQRLDDKDNPSTSLVCVDELSFSPVQ